MCRDSLKPSLWHSTSICILLKQKTCAEILAAPPTTSTHLFPRELENHTGDLFQQILDHFLVHFFSLLAKFFLQFTHPAANALTLNTQRCCNIIIFIQMLEAFKNKSFLKNYPGLLFLRKRSRMAYISSLQPWNFCHKSGLHKHLRPIVLFWVKKSIYFYVTHSNFFQAANALKALQT